MINDGQGVMKAIQFDTLGSGKITLAAITLQHTLQTIIQTDKCQYWLSSGQSYVFNYIPTRELFLYPPTFTIRSIHTDNFL